MKARTAQEILRDVNDTLAVARQGLEDVKHDPKRRMSGLRNVVVFGRAVTNVLQNLRSVRRDFDEWYLPIRREMESSPRMKFFYNLRSEILKTGQLRVTQSVHLVDFSPGRDMAKFGKPPPNARSFFIGDSVGGTGWEVELAPGVVEKYYVALPSEIGSATLLFRDAPGLDGKADRTEGEVVMLCSEYIETLAEILKRAQSAFGSAACASNRYPTQ